MSDDSSEADFERITVDANGLNFGCLRAGSGDRLALCLHGFPDDAGSMMPIIDRLADAGYTAVAPYMRGYAPTDPAPDGDYSGIALGQDAIALEDTLSDRYSTNESVLVGHDWGASASYAAAALDPNAFERMATLAVPPRFVSLLFKHPRQLFRSWYMWFFQLPGMPERALRWREYSMVEFLWGIWSPGWEYPNDRIESVKETLGSGQTVEHALQYYRDSIGSAISDAIRHGPPEADHTNPVGVPTLLLGGELDGCIGIELIEDAGPYLDDGRIVRVRDAGHFLHQERPDVVCEELLEWFE